MIQMALQKIDARMLTSFVEKSLSAETRRKYRATVEDFARFIGHLSPREVEPTHVAAWRDQMRRRNLHDATIIFKLCVIRSLFEYLKEGGHVERNPASTKVVSPPKESETTKGRALSPKEVRHLLAGPDQSKAEGARDYAVMLLMLRLGLRVGEVCALKASGVKWEQGRWTLRCKVKGGRTEVWPLPPDIKKAIERYLELDRKRRQLVGSDGDNAFLFQPMVNYRTLQFAKGISTRMAQYIVGRWADYAGIGKVSPHDLRRTIVTEMLNRGYTYREVQMVTKHKDPKTIMKYDKARENLEANPVNKFSYEDE